MAAQTVGVETIREMIVSECVRNNRIREGDLAKKLGVSRTPIREILKHLEEDGLVERRRKAGISLRQTSLQEVIKIYDMRSVLEGFACKLIADNPDKKILEEITRANADFNAVRYLNPLERRKRDILFHRTILKHCGNPYLTRTVDKLNILTTSFQLAHKIIPGGVNRKMERYPHEKVIEALAAGDGRKAEEMMRLHVEERKNNIIRFVLNSDTDLKLK